MSFLELMSVRIRPCRQEKPRPASQGPRVVSCTVRRLPVNATCLRPKMSQARDYGRGSSSRADQLSRCAAISFSLSAMCSSQE